MDVAKYVAKELGHKEGDITFVQAPSAQRETLIKTGQVDMVVATYSITDKRKAEVSFAGPYFIAGQDLLVRADETAITGPETLAGKKLCSVKGSTSAQKVKDKYPGVQLQEFGTYSECVAALVSKGVDASRIETFGFGKTTPVKSCPDQKDRTLIECLAPNRRVVVEVQGTPR